MKRKEIYTTRELAGFLGISESTLRTMRYRGTGPNYFPLTDSKRSAIRYRDEDVQKFIENSLRSSTK